MASNGRRAAHRQNPSSTRSSTGAVSKRCAREVVETIPLVMRFLRREVRRRSSPLPSVPQVRALAMLDREPGASLSDLAEHLNVTSPTASLIVNRLVLQKLVHRAEHPHERRRRVLTLTPAGAQQLKAMRAVACAVVEKVLSGGGEQEIATIVQGLDQLKIAFERAMRNGYHNGRHHVSRNVKRKGHS